MTAPFVDPIHAMETILLQPAPNGGWTVMAKPAEGNARVVGAFSTYPEMLRALGAGREEPECALCNDTGYEDYMHLRMAPCQGCAAKALAAQQMTAAGGLQ